ncbi:uncharacterized protein [Aegilops tauschii subsp. strangulata]|uniref:uncharacterized protein n=1 Tax=Aegilops tauschii subsp. strangulata TaxID=200361 RepID=UPI00098ACE6A
MMKAYDWVEWSYLEAIMLKLGFTQRWMEIVMGMVTTVKFSVMFNGSKLQQFTPSRGIWQGDPISPYLFLLAAEGLPCLLKSKVESSNLGGLQVAPLAPPVNHLLFADDSLLFFKANAMGADEINQLLEHYCQATGQRVNYSKSSIFFSKGVPGNVRAEIKELLHVPNETLNEKYLGMPSDVGSSRNGAFKFLKYRLWSKIQGWIEKSLSTVGKEGWRILQQPDSLSARILKGVCFPNSSILHAQVGSHPSQIWRSIMEGVEVLKLGLIKRIGNGESTDVWTENWIPSNEMLRPYGCRVQNPMRLAADYIDYTSATWDKHRVEQTFLPIDVSVILTIPISTRIFDDYWACNFERNDIFSVCSAYRMLVATRQRREAWLDGTSASSSSNMEEKSWKMLWKTQVPAKVRMFLWRLSKQSLPTEDVRAHRHMPNTSSCGLCGSSDSWRHSLLECSMARCVWALDNGDLVSRMITSTEPRAKYWLFGMMELLSHSEFVRLSVTLWAIWSARRKFIHEGMPQSPHSTHAFIQHFIDEISMLQNKPAEVQNPPGMLGSHMQGLVLPPLGTQRSILTALFSAIEAAPRQLEMQLVTLWGSSSLVIEGQIDPATLEAIACREGMALAEDLLVHDFIISSDCKQAEPLMAKHIV